MEPVFKPELGDTAPVKYKRAVGTPSLGMRIERDADTYEVTGRIVETRVYLPGQKQPLARVRSESRQSPPKFSISHKYS